MNKVETVVGILITIIGAAFFILNVLAGTFGHVYQQPPPPANYSISYTLVSELLVDFTWAYLITLVGVAILVDGLRRSRKSPPTSNVQG